MVCRHLEGLNLPAECKHQNEQQVEDPARDLGTTKPGNDKVREGAGKQEKDPADEEQCDATRVNSISPFGVSVKSHGVEPKQERENSHELATAC